MRRLAFAPLIAPVAAAAHETWLAPIAFRFSGAHAAVPVRFLVSDVADMAPWLLAWGKVVALSSYGPGDVRDQQAGIAPTNAARESGAMVQEGMS